MSGFAILDLVIGVIFIYFLMSLLCSVIQEIISGIFRFRAKNLNQWLVDAFDKGNLGEAILKHKLIDGLTAKGRLAAYFPADKFSRALIDIIHHKHFGDKPYTLDTLRQAVIATELLDDDFKRVFLQRLSESAGDIDAPRKFIESWFNDCMERISGTYKKKIQICILWISLITTGLLNVDSIALSSYLYNNPTARKQLADHAAEISKDDAYKKWVEKIRAHENDSLLAWSDVNEAVNQFERNAAEVNSLQKELSNQHLPIGWEENKVSNWFNKVIGLLLTAFAVSLGAPFWFDMLNKLVNLRSTGPDPEKEKHKK